MEASGDEAMAKLTQSGQLVGSIDYLPPERAQGREPGPASDIWSLGMTLYAAVEGTAPFRRTSVWSTLSAIVTEPLPEPRRAGALTPVLRALMAKEPENRPTADQAREMLERVAAGGTANLAPPAAVPTPTQAVTPTPPPGFGAAPPFHQAAPQTPQTPQTPQAPHAPYTGYPPPGPPHPIPQAGAPVAGHAPGPGRSPDGRGRRRGRALVAAAAAAVVLAGGGVTYALVGNGGTNGDEAQAAAPGAGSPAGSGQPGGSGPTGVWPPSASPSKAPHGKPSGAASHASGSPKAKPSATAKPRATTAKPSAVSKSCDGWSHRDAKPGSYEYLTGDFRLVTGPYQACSSVTRAKSGTKLHYQCYVTNAYGNKWLYVRVDGASTSGWMSADNLTRQSGQPVRC